MSTPAFFARVLLGNLGSKTALVLADGIAAYALSTEGFGAYALLQGLIISGAILGVWGRDQAIISVVVRSGGGGSDLRKYLRTARLWVAFLSTLAALLIVLIAYFSQVAFTHPVLLGLAFLVMAEGQLMINSTALRACSRAYAAVLFFDGMRNLFLLLSAIAVLLTGGGFGLLLCGWCLAATISMFLGARSLSEAVASRKGNALTDSDHRHATEIVKFSGMWGLSRLAISQLVLVFSSYMLLPNELGVVAFYMKLLTVFTFIQTVMVQTVAPVIGRLGQTQSLAEARHIYRSTTIFLAAAAAPAIGAFLISAPWVADAFEMNIDNLSAWVLPLLFFAHALNIGTGIIGHFIIHFGHSRALLLISIFGAAAKFLLLLVLGNAFRIEGVLMSQAVAAVVLLVACNVFAGARMGVHGFGVQNLSIIGISIAGYLLAELFGIGSLGLEREAALAGYLVFSTACVAAICLPELYKLGTSFRRPVQKEVDCE